jgi:ubiquinone/menaquinone biosynthesis C-methylase UbiE
MSLNNYDFIADYYDGLSRLVFFNSQTKAQKEQLSHLKPGSSILIIGGGTGWILDEITKHLHSGLNITYIEISEKMLKLAKKRNLGGNELNFVHLPIEEFETSEMFDVVHTAFLFDNFSEERAKIVFEKLDCFLKPGGLWLFSDFQYLKKPGVSWQWLLLKSMYVFFKLISDVEADQLVNMEATFAGFGYNQLNSKTYYRNFIKAIVYRKQLTNVL